MGKDGLSPGFTLLEVLVATVVLTVAAVSLLQSFGIAMQFYNRSNRSWHTSIDKWNLAQQIRTHGAQSSEKVPTLEEARPLYRFFIQEDGRTWEVLRAQK
ncbi:MAG: prepilin-type N-terminal cleavage/methylation domain-containing protein [Acidobacteria bacterium]|nr:prepilin-type N-terminal cleavage/methylation domain-containing protein [Acidobacteriota bacterium]